MSTYQEPVELRPTAPIASSDQRRVNPIKWFAVIGALCWAMEIYVFTRWLASGPSPTDGGPDEVPTFMTVAARCMEIISPIAMVVTLWFLVIKPWRREGTIGLPGMLCFACLGTWWQDMAFNYFNHTITVNTTFLNLGSWYGFIPGWTSPNGTHMVEPIIFTGPVFIWAIVLPAMAIAAVMRKAKARWPRIGVVGLLGVAISVAALVDLLYEIPFSRLGLYSYVGSIPSLTIFAGEYYQFPVYEAVLFGIEFAALGALLYFRDDRGYTVAERGIDRLQISRRATTAVRLLALTGFCGLVYATYNVTFGAVSLLPGFKWADDVVENRSYLRADVCGGDTGYACPSGSVPIPRKGGAHVDPNGKLVIPRGVDFP